MSGGPFSQGRGGREIETKGRGSAGGAGSGSFGPRSDEVNTAMLEIGGVAGCHGRAMRACNGGNHGIKLRYRAARCVSRGDNAGKRAGGILIEGQDPALKLLGEHL